jgi:unsaturated chondroitin disaccharide hydrolase
MQRLALIALASIPCLMSEAVAGPLDTSKGIASDLSFIERQVTKTLSSLGPPSINSYPVSGGDSGTWNTTSPSDGAEGWTTGFFPGQLWLLYQATGSQKWLHAAKAWTAPLAPYASLTTHPRVDPTDIGFIIGTSFGNGYRLTGAPAYKNVLLGTGKSLSSLYNPTVGAVQSWTFPQFHFPVIIDSMMTLGPLQWGASNGGRLTWAGMANTHAQTVTTNLVRLGGSTYQLSDFNPVTGAPESPQYYQTGGLSSTSVWARGQAWALYGFVQAYQTSDNPAFLTTAEALATYFVENSPNGIPPWDFDATGTPPVDTSAAAIAADGLVMLSTVAGTSGSLYLQDAENILGSLSSSYLDVDPTGESVLIDGFPGHGATNTALIYGDYYFTEALLRLQNVLDGKPGWALYSPQSVLGGQPALLLSSLTVPEPSTWAMMLLGFAGLGFAGYRRARAGRATLAGSTMG